jgi:hypothetical protein
MNLLSQLASNKLYLAAAIACAVLVLLAVVVIIWRHRRASRSKYGFRAERDSATAPAPLRDAAARDSNELDEFDSKRGQRIADVLLDYANAKGPQLGVYAVRLGPLSKVWWVGEKFPSSNKGIVAAVHAGRRPGKGFRAKVVVLKEAAEADTLAAALKRAAQPKDAPLMHDSWGRPISFDAFPLLPTGNAPLVDLAAVAARAATKAA